MLVVICFFDFFFLLLLLADFDNKYTSEVKSIYDYYLFDVPTFKSQNKCQKLSELMTACNIMTASHFALRTVYRIASFFVPNYQCTSINPNPNPVGTNRFGIIQYGNLLVCYKASSR